MSPGFVISVSLNAPSLLQMATTKSARAKSLGGKCAEMGSPGFSVYVHVRMFVDSKPVAEV